MVIVVVNVALDASLKCLNALETVREKNSDFSVPKKLSIVALSWQLPLRDMLCVKPRLASSAW